MQLLILEVFNDTTKQHQFIDYFTEQKLDIIGLSELHVTNKNFSKQSRFTSDRHYDYYWAINDDSYDLVLECGLVFTKELAQHIQKVQSFDGCIIIANLFFKRYNRIHIIQIYIPPTNQIAKRNALAIKLQSILKEAH